MAQDEYIRSILKRFDIADLVQMPDSEELQKIISEHKNLLSLDEIQQLKKIAESNNQKYLALAQMTNDEGFQ